MSLRQIGFEYNNSNNKHCDFCFVSGLDLLIETKKQVFISKNVFFLHILTTLHFIAVDLDKDKSATKHLHRYDFFLRKFNVESFLHTVKFKPTRPR